jgi:hypothetical protein
MTKLEKQNAKKWDEICNLLRAHGYEMDRYGNMVKGEKGSAVRYKKMARNVRKERDFYTEGYDGKMERLWRKVWSIPLKQLAIVDGKITKNK